MGGLFSKPKAPAIQPLQPLPVREKPVPAAKAKKRAITGDTGTILTGPRGIQDKPLRRKLGE